LLAATRVSDPSWRQVALLKPVSATAIYSFFLAGGISLDWRVVS
jgi:hypothetical protein